MKDMGSDSRPMTPDEQAYAQQIVHESFEHFITDVTTQRVIARSDIEDGRVIRGRRCGETQYRRRAREPQRRDRTAQRDWRSRAADRLDHPDRVRFHELAADRCRIVARRQGEFQPDAAFPSIDDSISVLRAIGRHAPSNFVCTKREARSKSAGVIEDPAMNSAIIRSAAASLPGLFLAGHEDRDAAPCRAGYGSRPQGHLPRSRYRSCPFAKISWSPGTGTVRPARHQTAGSGRQLKSQDWYAETNIERSLGGSSWSAPA